MADKEKKVVEASEKSAKPAKEKKKGKMKEAWRGFKSELKKIVWSSKNDVKKNTIVVVVAVIAIAVVVGLLDFAFGKGIVALGKLF